MNDIALAPATLTETVTETLPGTQTSPVLAVGRALQVLDGFLQLDRPATLTEVTRVAGLSKSTTFRLIKQLVDSGYLIRRGSEYSLSLHVFRLGNRYSRQSVNALREVASPHLGALFAQTSAMVNLAVLDANAIVYLDRLQSLQTPNAPGGVGTRLPAAPTALGKAILAFSPAEATRAALASGLIRLTPRSVVAPGLFHQQLERAAEEGVAYDREETALGLNCVAAPILVDGVAIAAISASASTGRFQAATLAPLVKRTAERIAQEYARRLD